MSDLEEAAPNQALATTEQIDANMLMAADQAFQNNVESYELRMMRLSICQGTTAEIAETKKGYQLGQIISSTTREILSKYGPAPWLKDKTDGNTQPVHYLAVIPVMKLPTEFVEWVPKNEQKPGERAIRFKSLDPKESRVLDGTYKTRGGRFDPGPNNNAPPIVTTNNYLFLPFDEENQAVKEGFGIGSFAKTSAPAGSTLSTFIQNRRAQRIFAWDSVYYLFTSPKKTPKGFTQIYNIAYGGLVKDICPDLQSMARQMAVKCSDPSSGRELQVAMLQAAELSADNDEHVTPPSGSDSALDVTGSGGEADEAFGDGSAQKF